MDAYFRREDQYLIDRLQSLRQLEETKENLTKVSGFTDSSVLEKLIQLDIRPQDRPLLRKEILGHARQAAEAAGGAGCGKGQRRRKGLLGPPGPGPS